MHCPRRPAVISLASSLLFLSLLPPSRSRLIHRACANFLDGWKGWRLGNAMA
uniref:Uncharacterized protein n=1 Tax=Arundo donax TaxID=35708 RepID=A0A0A8Z9J6_ARUDO